MKINLFSFRISTAIIVLAISLSSAFTASFAQTQKDGRGMHVDAAKMVESLPAGSKRYALVVGVDEYQDTQISKLDGAGNDAKSIVEALVRYAGFPREQVVLLTSDQPVERKPTRGNILRRLSNLRSAMTKDGLLLVAFAGHGIEREGQAYLLPSDAQVSGDVTLLEDTAINVEEMRKRIVQTGVGQVVMILDACRNDPSAGRGDSDNPLSKKYTQAFNFEERNLGIEAFVTLYATGVGYRAYENREKGQGYFTSALVEGLGGAAANQKGEVTLDGLMKYLQDIVPKRISLDLGPGKVQKPFADIKGYKASDLILAKTAVAVEASIPDPAAVERNTWETIQASADSSGFRDYLKKYPNGVFAEQAFWEMIKSSKDPNDFKQYLKNYPAGKNARVAAMIAEDTLWERIQTTKSVADYKKYLSEYPNGRYAELAIRRTQPPAPPPTSPDTTTPKPAKGVLVVLTNAPAANILIKSRNAAVSPVRGQSNEDGKFRAELSPGVYDVEVSAAKYSSKKFDGVKLETDEFVKADLIPLVGSIQIGPIEANANVLIDGVKPASMSLKKEEKLIELAEIPAGPHKLKIIQPNQNEWTRDVEVEGGKTKYIPTEFKAALVSLLVKTEPEAEVYVDDFYGGRANERGELKVTSLAPGQHRIKAKKNEYQPVEKTQSFTVGAAEMKLALTRVVFSSDFADDFTAGAGLWNAPATWQAKPGNLKVQGKGFGLIKDADYKDFRMDFDISFTNGKGAVWILRAQDENTYYLFQMTGPNAQDKEIFRTYLYQNGQAKLLKVARVPESLSVPGDKFHIKIEVNGPEIKHYIRVKSNPKVTEPQPFGLMTDTTFSHGRIGFGSLEGEEFTVQFVSVIPAK
jgi:uncharacterized caspase-like protein